MLSKVFPKGHIREGKPTGFKALLYLGNKKHTIRENYTLWAARAEEINSGKAILSIRQWKDKPYRSKAVEIRSLTHLSVQKIELTGLLEKGYLYLYDRQNKEKTAYPAMDIAHNDGLRLADFESWFSGYDLSKEMAVLHFNPNGWYL